MMKPRNLLARFLPHEPDVLGLLAAQAQVTVDGMAALVAWSQGEVEAGRAVRAAEHKADELKRALWLALRDAFITPLEPEDLFFVSAKLDAVLGGAKDAVREAEVTATAPDEAIAAMAQALAEGVGHLQDAFGAFGGGRNAFTEATASADAAHKAVRGVERLYREAMAALLLLEDPRLVTSRRELYRRMSRMGAIVTEIADRVWYTAVKEG